MAVKLTKNELKTQKDQLKQFERYLPTLQLKKQQLQLVIRQIYAELDEKTKDEIDDDYDLCQKGEELIYQCVKELMTKEFPRLIKEYEE